MHQQIQKITQTAKRVLISPLDWGLGHATRCIPIIQSLLNHNIEVFIATSGKIESLLKAEFPQAHFLELKGYNVRYSKKGSHFIWMILKQFPAIKQIIQYEHNWLQHVIEKYKIDWVISDNRFGLYTDKAPCTFITHQLYIKTGINNIIDKLTQQFNYKYINRFTECWVPDLATPPGLSGELGHPKHMPNIPVHYIGPLSRFHILPQPPKIIYKAVILLSGPEPQRTIFEELIQQQAVTIQGQFALVRALPEGTSNLNMPNNWEVFNHLPAEKLNILLQQTEYIISRTGYTTIMDIWMLKKKSILIPTPGQPEQIYLAKVLYQNGFSAIYDPKMFDLLTIFPDFYSDFF